MLWTRTGRENWRHATLDCRRTLAPALMWVELRFSCGAAWAAPTGPTTCIHCSHSALPSTACHLCPASCSPGLAVYHGCRHGALIPIPGMRTQRFSPAALLPYAASLPPPLRALDTYDALRADNAIKLLFYLPPSYTTNWHLPSFGLRACAFCLNSTAAPHSALFPPC